MNQNNRFYIILLIVIYLNLLIVTPSLETTWADEVIKIIEVGDFSRTLE